MYQNMGKRGPNLLQVIWRSWESNPGPFKIVLDIKTIELYDEGQTSTRLKFSSNDQYWSFMVYCTKILKANNFKSRNPI